MTASRFYRRFSRNAVRQGDIALAEVVQIKARSGDRPDPEGAESASPEVPFFAEPENFALSFTDLTGREQHRLVRVWPTPVIVLHQTCEIEFSNPSDSRLIVAPIATVAQWPEGPWELIRKNVLPGYFYLPSLDVNELREVGLPAPWGESTVVLAGTSLSSVGVIKRRRMLALSIEAVSGLQDAVSRFHGVRGFADVASFAEVIGRPIKRVVETGLTVSGPSRVIKVYFGEGDSETDHEEDERSYSYWGARTPLERKSS